MQVGCLVIISTPSMFGNLTITIPSSRTTNFKNDKAAEFLDSSVYDYDEANDIGLRMRAPSVRHST